MKTSRKLSRRSFLGQVVGGAAGVGALALVGADTARAAQPDCSDSDTGTYGDPAGQGRRCTGASDSDPSDPVGSSYGGRSGASDSDPSDPVGYGHGGGNCSDSDTGRNGDPIGRGRRCGGRRSSGVTDSDTGRNGDPANQGRRGRRTRTGITDSDSGAGSDLANYGQGGVSCIDIDRGRCVDPVGCGSRC